MERNMKKDIVIFHGSQQVVEVPEYGAGKIYNDYGRGFYCTESIELAKEWACPVKNDGYANKYILHTEGLNVMHLTESPFNILSWLAVLLQNRRFEINNNIGREARDYLLENFLPDTSGIDIIIGYRADDSYFSFAEDFVNNTISVGDLNAAMQLGTLGQQVVLISRKAFEQMEFVEYEIADHREYYYKRTRRDKQARSDYMKRKRDLSALKDDLFILDIIREGIKNDDTRLQLHLSE